MRQLLLTALATEHDLTNGGAEKYFLVFNGGELRIPIPAESVEPIIQKLYGNGEAQAPSQGFTQEEYEEEKRVMLAETRQGVVMGQVGSTYSEEDGVDQV